MFSACWVPCSLCESGPWFTHVVSSCYEDRIILGNARLCWAHSLRGHCVNAPHLPADLGSDWLLMTFLGHRHVKLFIYSKKSPMQIDPLSTLDFSSSWLCVSISVLVSVCFSWTGMMCCSHQQSLWYNNRAAVFLFVYACVCLYVSVCILCMWQIWDILDLLLRKWHTPEGYNVQKESSANSKPQFSRTLSYVITLLL